MRTSYVNCVLLLTVCSGLGFGTLIRPNNGKPNVNSNAKWRADGRCPSTNRSNCSAGYDDNPPLLLISLDGFWAGYLQRNLTPAIAKLASCGVRAEHMIPSHPTITFPNHYSIVTGLNIESHGIVDNTFHDFVLNQTFNYHNASSINQTFWWRGEPIWVTARKHGKRAHAFYWIGSDAEIQGVRPNVWRRYNKSTPFEERIDTVLDWLSSPQKYRPDITTLYLEEPDFSGHLFGPAAGPGGVDEALKRVDSMIDRLIHGLQDRNILQCVNIMIVSDHGMQQIACKKSLYVDDILVANRERKGMIQSEDVSVFANSATQARITLLGTTKHVSIGDLYDALECTMSAAPNSSYRPYTKSNLPRRQHYTYSSRLEPIIINLQPESVMYKNKDIVKCQKGNHGYDNILYSSMDAIFLAYGPSFKSKMVIAPFKNIELYNLMAELIGTDSPAPNNGTKGSLHHILKHPSILEETSYRHNPTGDLIMDDIAVQQKLNQMRCGCPYISNRDVSNSILLHGMLSSFPSGEMSQIAPFGVPESRSFFDVVLLTNSEGSSVTGYSRFLKMPIWNSFVLDQPYRGGFTQCARKIMADTCGGIPVPSTADIVYGCLCPEGLSSSVMNVPMAVPMFRSFKSGIWNTLWNTIGSWIHHQNLHIQVGPVFDNVQPYGLADPIDVMSAAADEGFPIPSHYFVIVTNSASPFEPNTIADVSAFLVPHLDMDPERKCQNDLTYIWTHSASVDDVEKITGLKFFTNLPIYEAIKWRIKQPPHLKDALNY